MKKEQLSGTALAPSQVEQLLMGLYEIKPAVFLAGPPGIGKSSVIKGLTEKLGVDFWDVRGVLHDPGDLKFPVVDVKKKTIDWVCSVIPTDPDWEGIVLLDELPNCPPLVQSAFLQLVLDRKIGQQKVPDGAWILAAGNRPEDRSGSHRLISSLRSRFIWLEMTHSVDDWTSWSLTAGIHAAVRAWVKAMPQNLYRVEIDRPEMEQSNPRTIHFLSNVLEKTPTNLRFQVAAGCVGQSVAADFMAFMEVWEKMPDPMEVLKSPGSFTIPTEPSILWALVCAISARAREFDRSLLSATVKLALRIPAEYSMLLMQDVDCVNNKLTTIDEFKTWLNKHGNVFKSLRAA